ncbi:hypothetical protein, unlikely [Trypanosoma brucei gambiense DAL972]|uniref:Uncharacterized protein n=1 Tax=Trypanosoma brucei gambiense (strain MHOM/CI/86/DAL972) TaxID=679716 RepID=C9ZYQ5_TRYB9|nr:hypothetical protein, unlikely [Trypanosoma brucei gambiense DAL972]CBH14554.1 hypothetical protein, unlikely [Trypanosoma brucei gambiense DAL972]|eukprot:XP_011776820.1 hypothetical protein, unlikely [Trypanosoma brucei gambiense DAL972]
MVNWKEGGSRSHFLANLPPNPHFPLFPLSLLLLTFFCYFTVLLLFFFVCFSFSSFRSTLMFLSSYHFLHLFFLSLRLLQHTYCINNNNNRGSILALSPNPTKDRSHKCTSTHTHKRI